MGLLDTITEITNSIGKDTSASQGLLKGVVDLLGRGQGLRGILDSFSESGLEDIVKSWIGTGANKPISADQLEEVLGSDKLEELADRAGIPVEDTSQLLKDLLPKIIDKLSPNGKLAEDE